MKADNTVPCTEEFATGPFSEPHECSLHNHNLAEVSMPQKPISAIGHD
jgi:hypothetical protein